MSKLAGRYLSFLTRRNLKQRGFCSKKRLWLLHCQFFKGVNSSRCVTFYEQRKKKVCRQDLAGSVKQKVWFARQSNSLSPFGIERSELCQPPRAQRRIAQTLSLLPPATVRNSNAAGETPQINGKNFVRKRVLRTSSFWLLLQLISCVSRLIWVLVSGVWEETAFWLFLRQEFFFRAVSMQLGCPTVSKSISSEQLRCSFWINLVSYRWMSYLTSVCMNLVSYRLKSFLDKVIRAVKRELLLTSPLPHVSVWRSLAALHQPFVFCLHVL